MILAVLKTLATERAKREEYLKNRALTYDEVKDKVSMKEQAILKELQETFKIAETGDNYDVNHLLIYSDTEAPIWIQSDSSLKQIEKLLLKCNDEDLDKMYVFEGSKIKDFCIILNDEGNRDLRWVN